MHLQFFYFFSEHIRMAASDYHSKLSIILDIFRKNITLQDLFVPHGYKASVNLRQFVIIKVLYHDRYSKWNMSNHMLSKGEKRTKKPINTNVITRKPYGNVPWSTVVEIQFQSIQTFYYFQFLIFEIIGFIVWFYVLSVIFPRLLISLNFVSLICF